MSLITTAGLWNSEDDDIIETKKTRRVSSQQNNAQNKGDTTQDKTSQQQQQQQMFGPSQYPDTNNVTAMAILNKINSINVKNAGDNLMKFTPIKPPEMQNKKSNSVQQQQQQQQPSNIKYDSPNLGDSYSNYKNIYTPPLAMNENGSNLEGFSSKNSGNGVYSGNSGGNNLMEKINYAIYLLEQQQAQKTDHVIEEFILYGFVGVFIIFVVDNFNKTAKYTR